MIPKLTDPVIVVGIRSNGATEQAGMITRVWQARDLASGPMEVNVVIFPDDMPPLSRTSVTMYASLEQANAAAAKLPFCYPAPKESCCGCNCKTL